MILKISKRILFASVLLVAFDSNQSGCNLIESPPNYSILNPNWISLLKNNNYNLKSSNTNDNKLFDEIENIEMENLNVLNREQSVIDDNNNNNFFDNNQHDYQQQSTCQLVQIIHLLKHDGCQPKAITSFACSGSCSSYVQHERSCSCCQQTGLQEATFTLDCPSLEPPYKKVKTYAPVNCMCRGCTDLGRENLKPQELVEALAGENIKV